MGDTFALMRTLEEQSPGSALIVGAGYIGLEMAEALAARGLSVTQMEQLSEVLPTVDPEIGALVHGQLVSTAWTCSPERRPFSRQSRDPSDPAVCASTQRRPTARA